MRDFRIYGNRQRFRSTTAGALALLAVLATIPQEPAAADVLRVVATTPDLASLVREVGGNHVSVTSFTKGSEDPHFTEAKPSFIRELSAADLYVENGLDLEVGWAPALLRNARNGRVLPGAEGHLDASKAIVPLQVPSGPVDRSMGDVHLYGNPHYLSDPVNGLRVARRIRDALVGLEPEHRSYFSERLERFERRLAAAMVGEALADKYDAEKLALLYEHGKLGEFLASQGQTDLLQGWLGRLLPYYGTNVVADHNLWPYFARRFGIEVVGFLEPKPGISPTTRHMQELIETMRSRGVRYILAAPYYDPRFARFVAEKTEASIIEMAHQVGSRAGATDYLALLDENVGRLAEAFEQAQ